jgi:hypothetical protein
MPRRKQITRRFLKRGGGSPGYACEKWRYNPTNVDPPSPTPTETVDSPSYSDILAALEAIPSDEGLFLKVGSNDSPWVASMSATNDPKEKNDKPLVQGSKGKNGTLFVESPTLDGKVTKVLEYTPATSIGQPAMAIGRAFMRNAGGILHGLSISPVPIYEEFMYPAVENISQTSQPVGIPVSFASKKYVEAFFPVAPNPDKSSVNFKILNHLINREGALILCNAMGSYCYKSYKYIIDARIKDKRKTTFLGLVDNAATSHCSISFPVYPNPETVCDTGAGAGSKPAVATAGNSAEAGAGAPPAGLAMGSGAGAGSETRRSGGRRRKGTRRHRRR